ncbi:protein downstream neighbor of Son-like [Ylistrum balloti]|uniref:protein downstream neighbor of Son-like n=1 Tax=Ylistrum balloti TaxID=509963 RepID=UPI002905D2C8|nr:protein downstream neighbor of Son-like [Ylistrum balloti]
MEDLNSSPTWKKPSDIMKKHRKKKRISLQKASEKPPDKVTETCITKNVSLHAKRKNPFSASLESQTNSPSKRKKSDPIEMSHNPENLKENTFFKMFGGIGKVQESEESHCSIQTKESKPIPRHTENYALEDEDSKSQFDFLEKFFNNKQKEQLTKKRLELKTEDKQESDGLLDIPVDWSLKVKLRIISEKPLLWCTQLRTTDEARGITQFLKGNLDIQETEKKANFHEAGLYWIHPSIPWMKLFPRIVPDSKLRTASIGQDNMVQSALQSDWTESFTSVFHQLRAQCCPYFYVCTHQFSVLFRASVVAGQKNVSAVLTPTTRGMRESLTNEDISFKMPFLDRTKASLNPEIETEIQLESETKKCGQSYQHLDDDDHMIDTDEGASVWLESIGLDKKQFPSLEPNKVKMQREGFKAIDNRPESTVYVTGSDVQGLYNYLLNCRSCVATSGVQAGLPPTILAPRAFKGATLKSHKVKHSLVKQMDNNKQIKSVHILEVLGAVLPHHLANYMSLLSNTQEGEFSLTLNTHEPSVALNVPVGMETDQSPVGSETDQSPVGSETDKSKVGAAREQLEMAHKKFDPFFTNKALDSKLTCIKEVHCKQSQFSYLV